MSDLREGSVTYRIVVHIRGIGDEQLRFEKRCLLIEEGPTILKFWESEREWSAIPLASILFYDVFIE